MIQYEDFTQEDKDTYQWILDALGKRDPRQATVIRSRGKSVYVRFHGEDPTNPEMKFPTLIAGVAPGTTGWMFWLPGGKGIFVPWGVMLPIPFAFGVDGLNLYTTTSVGTPEWPTGLATTITVPPGIYRATGIATMPMKRSVATGRAFAYVEIGGQQAYNWSGTATTGADWYTIGVPMDVTFTTLDGDVELKFGLDGRQTAGTTSLYTPSMYGTLTRIG